MAVDDGCEHARFSCLATARYMVATVVTVLAVVVIVMVITVDVFRPENIGLSVLQGHVGVTDLWKVREVRARSFTTYARTVNKPLGSTCGGAQTAILASCSDDIGEPSRPTTTTTYVAEDYVSFGLILRADNPSGRADIRCENITLRFLDMPNGLDNFTGMTVMGWLLPRGFLVKRKSSHTLSRWNSTNSTTVLSHIASTYGGRSSFPGMVQVTMTISSSVTLTQESWTSPRNVSHFCGPLTFSVDEPSATAQPVQCTRSDEEDQLLR